LVNSISEHRLLALPKFGTGIGLHRVRYLMNAVGIDDRIGERCIAVTGSNGKGSTAKIASELMRFDGDSVGLFTSPHLYRYNERFQLDGVPIADLELASTMDEVLRAVEDYRSARDDAVGAFEAQFVVALKYFQSCRARWIVLEAGIGGRYDPVRLVRAPVCGLVSLDFEHTDLLGATLPEIAFDKLDATRRGGIVVLGESCAPIEREIRTYLELVEVTPEFVRPEQWHDSGFRDGRQHFDSLDPNLRLPGLESRLVGRHQINNHAVAIRLCCLHLQRAGLWPQPNLADRWRRAIAGVVWPGRLECVRESPPVYVDVGHTPEGILAALKGYMAMTPQRKSILVTGGSTNKNVKKMLEILAPCFDQIICTAAHHNGLAATEILGLVRSINPSATTKLCPTMEEAVAEAIRDAANSGRTVYVAGGLFLATEFAEFCRGSAKYP
jgi:dihydrofolate synthase / folylpolyglutamate synthase